MDKTFIANFTAKIGNICYVITEKNNETMLYKMENMGEPFFMWEYMWDVPLYYDSTIEAIVAMSEFMKEDVIAERTR